MSLAIDIKSRQSDTRDARIERLLLRAEIEQFNAVYGMALDDQRLSDWSEMFTEDASYVVLSRENHDRGMPVGLIYCENQAMIRDRAFALEKTAMFAPRYLRHFVSNTRVIGVDPDGSIRASANYLLLQVLFDRPDATLHQVGVYHDIFRSGSDGLKLAKRHCVYDNLLVPNALCLPV
jgi:anthranilate 1,2-dioxygenase small subunit